MNNTIRDYDIPILVVEDEHITALDIQQTLMRIGYKNVALAHSGNEAVSQAVKIKPKLIFMDVNLGGEPDGISASDIISTELPGTPIIFLTAYVDETTVQRAKITQPYGYMVKPFNQQELHIAIEIARYRKEVDDELQKSRALFRNILFAFPSAICVLDNNMRVQFTNKEFALLYKSKDSVGVPLNKILPPHKANNDMLFKTIQRAQERDQEVSLSHDQILQTEARQSFPAHLSVLPISIPDSNQPGWLLIIEDRSLQTQIRQLQDEVQDLRDQMSSRIDQLM